MSFGMPVDVLGTLSDKLKQMLKETQEHYSTFLNSSQLYKQRNMSENEFFEKITHYLVTVSALDFLAVRVVLELKSAMDKGTSVKEVSGGGGGAASSSHQADFGISGFIGTGGTVGGAGGTGHSISTSELSSQPPTFTPVDIELPRPLQESNENLPHEAKNKNCIVCGVVIPVQARFCTRCGNSQ
jgi:hypothetical protein